MKAAWIEAERVEEVRAAARGWKIGGAIGTGTFEEILGRYPEPRPLPALLWRILVFVFVSLAVLLLFSAFAFSARGGLQTTMALLFVFGAACLVATEAQENAPRLALRGGAGATSFWGIVFLLGGLFLFLEETLKVREKGGVTIVVLSSLALWALAAWRWGSPVYAGFAGISLFLLLARAPTGRLLWLAGGIALMLAFGRVLDRPSWSPSHRRGVEVLVAVGLLGAYAAVNLYSLDHRLVEKLGSAGLDSPGPRFGERIESIALTALIPLAAVVWGIRSRRLFAVDTGLVLTALSLLTFRVYVHIATWLLLTLAGAALLLFALGVNRWLARSGGRERHGFTADPLFADERRLRALELVPVVAAHAPESQPEVEPRYQGGGGSFGGGGAGGSY
ncbi:MAG TPA: hypothetical protein VLJ18_05460 [Thermoanaerobaculia bacterium]|nr:hypothetical protein [Thermoanaerobaculia bacterium]